MEQDNAALREAAVFPDPAAVARLALSESGFVFDPVTGRSYTVNATGLAVLRLLQKPTDLARLTAALEERFESNAGQVERDVLEFAAALRSHVK